jgi:probable rRNA maturation factor
MILIDPELAPSPAPSTASGAKLPSVRTLARFLAKAQAAVRLRGQVTVLLTSDAAMRDMNRRFRGKNKATDVLSFPASDLVQNQKGNQEKGDLAISVETARRQGTACGHSLGTELKVLMLHGLLHLAGYDHETDDGEMYRHERKLRSQLGLPEGLIERAAAPTLSPKSRRKDGARIRKTTAGPSTRSLRELAQDDNTKSVRSRKP